MTDKIFWSFRPSFVMVWAAVTVVGWLLALVAWWPRDPTLEYYSGWGKGYTVRDDIQTERDTHNETLLDLADEINRNRALNEMVKHRRKP